jgi:hypothetical protein
MRILAENIKVGFVFWWSQSNLNLGNWSCPAEIVSVDNGIFKIKPYDDLQISEREFDLGTFEKECSDEMEITNQNDVHNYIAIMIAKKNHQINEARIQIQKSEKTQEMFYLKDEELFQNNIFF